MKVVLVFLIVSCAGVAAQWDWGHGGSGGGNNPWDWLFKPVTKQTTTTTQSTSTTPRTSSGQSPTKPGQDVPSHPCDGNVPDLSQDCYEELRRYGIFPFSPYCPKDECEEKYVPVRKINVPKIGRCDVVCPSMYHLPQVVCSGEICKAECRSRCLPSQHVEYRVLVQCPRHKPFVWHVLAEVCCECEPCPLAGGR
ncbi:uncharacterized protein LOC106153472 [Lingula anatina]|uniref:Uncharacterized protein LOC106153472 n=1 Tax=Lingula anatina TaxID=7574 RepID=A0A1S3HBH7_LINAN|nr:uncharacterized protein LOC106153472 [Lingula anatina]|eukprot:XP_013382866.1 uncharacterized protein LOC106153472 [Lingula anatina]